MYNFSNFFKKSLLLVAGTFATFAAFAQSLNNVFVASGGVFEFSPPYTDYVTVGLESDNFATRDVVHTQSVQQAIAYDNGLLVSNNIALAAQDSLVLYNAHLGHLQRTAIVGIPDAFASYHSLYKTGTKLFAGKWYGSSPDFLYYYDAQTLQNQGAVTGITQDVAGMSAIGDTLYVTQSLPTWNFYADSLSYITKVYLPTRTFVGNSFYAAANLRGAKDVYTYNNKLYIICTGSNNIATYDPATGAMQYAAAGGALGKGFYIDGNNLCMLRNYAAQIYNIATQQWTDLSCYTDAADNVVCATPTTMHSVAGTAFIGVTDYSSYGKMYGINGNCQRTVSNVGISPEAATAFFYIWEATTSVNSTINWTLAPNPATDNLQIDVPIAVATAQIVDMLGRTVWQTNTFASTISVAALPQGSYALQLITQEGVLVKKFVKQ
jgi:hypothetical protein